MKIKILEKAKVAIFISGKTNFKSKAITGDKKRTEKFHFGFYKKTKH